MLTKERLDLIIRIIQRQNYWKDLLGGSKQHKLNEYFALGKSIGFDLENRLANSKDPS